MKNLIILLFIISQTTNFFAQKMGTQSLAELQESPAGSKILKFLETINHGKDLTTEDAKKLFSARLVEKYGADELVNMLEDIRNTDGQLELYDVNRTDMFEYKTKLKGLKENHWLDFNLKVEKQSPYKIDGFGIEANNKPAKAKKPMLSPSQKIGFESKPVKFSSQNEIASEADRLAKIYGDMNWFSGVIVIAKDGKPFYEKAFGLADIDKNIPNTVKTKFRIGSINKTFTDVLVMQMVEKGKFSFEDKLSKFDLGFPEKMASKITIRHLMLHQAGLKDIFIPEYYNNIRAYKDINDILPLLRNEPLIFEPGTDQQYSNYGYIILGAILEKTSGRQFEDLLQENILDKIGLKDTHYNIAENIEGEAQSYLYNLDGTKTDFTANLEYCTPDGGMYSTASDLLSFYQNLFFTENLVKNKMKLMRANNFKNAKGDWGKLLKRSQGMGDAGGGPGVSTLVEMQFRDNFTIIVLANTDHQIAEELGLRLWNFSIGKKTEKAKLPIMHFVVQTIDNQGLETFKKNAKKLFKENDYDYNSRALNRAGYFLLQNNMKKDALEIFKINVSLFPKEANPYDSLAEAYWKTGDLENAEKYYKKALEIDPQLPSAKKALRELKKG